MCEFLLESVVKSVGFLGVGIGFVGERWVSGLGVNQERCVNVVKLNW